MRLVGSMRRGVETDIVTCMSGAAQNRMDEQNAGNEAQAPAPSSGKTGAEIVRGKIRKTESAVRVECGCCFAMTKLGRDGRAKWRNESTIYRLDLYGSMHVSYLTPLAVCHCVCLYCLPVSCR
jgi:hypothetical protein